LEALVLTLWILRLLHQIYSIKHVMPFYALLRRISSHPANSDDRSIHI
jgi:hypothetical protein